MTIIRAAFLLVVAGLSLRSVAAGVETTIPAERFPSAFAIPRGVVVAVPLPQTAETPSIMNMEMISTGEKLVPLESDEGTKILHEGFGAAANLRSDGTIMHRQHHPTDFPPKR